MKRKKLYKEVPSSPFLERAVARAGARKKFGPAVRRILGSLLVLAAFLALVATFFFPVLVIRGDAMSPYLKDGDLVVVLKDSGFEKGDAVGLYVGGKLLAKRIIAGENDWVDIRKDGTVFLNGEKLDEPYAEDKALGDCNIDLPCQIPEGYCFVMGDHRSTSADSRLSQIGFIPNEQIVGRVAYRLWPFRNFGKLS